MTKYGILTIVKNSRFKGNARDLREVISNLNREGGRYGASLITSRITEAICANLGGGRYFPGVSLVSFTIAST